MTHIPSKPCPKRPELDKLIEQAKLAFKVMSLEQKLKLRKEQRISWVYGNLSLSNPNITRKIIEERAEEEGW